MDFFCRLHRLGAGLLSLPRRRWRSSIWAQTFWQPLVSIVVVAAAICSRPGRSTDRWSPELATILFYNWVLTTALGYYLWNKVLTMMSAAVAGQVVGLTPVGGFVRSALIFGGAVSVLPSIAMIVARIMLTVRA